MMIKRRLFSKRKTISVKYFFFIFFILILLTISILLFYNAEIQFFEVDNFNDSFYIIPDDREGKKIVNLDKKSLHLIDKDKDDIQIVNNPLLEYSIQFFSSDNYNLTRNKLESVTKRKYYNQNSQENLLNKKDFFIVFFNNEINNEYLLLYKTFRSRDLAFNYCSKYLNYLEECLIVNAQNLN